MIEVADQELALHFVNGKFDSVLHHGKYAFWTQFDKHEYKRVAISTPEVSADVPQYIFAKIPTVYYIKIDADEAGNKYLIIHSGSRNLGTQVATFYQGISIDLNLGKEEYFIKRDEIIRTYKEQGRRNEIQSTLKQMEKEPSMPCELCYLYGEFMEDYLHDINICRKFAKRNREKMAEILLEKTGLSAIDAFQTVHNYIDVEEKILRKGSVSAREGEKLLIPINMRDGSLICIGKGNAGLELFRSSRRRPYYVPFRRV